VSAVEIERVDDVLGWPLVTVRGEDRPLIEDEELGRRLGFSRPRDVRALIREIFNDSDICGVTPQMRGPGRKGRRYFLTRSQALKVVMRSGTSIAEQIQDEIIDVYEAWLDGRVAPAPSLDVAAIVNMATQSALAAVMPIFDRMLSEERRAREESRLVIGQRRADLILGKIREIASLHAQRNSRAWRQTHRRVSNDVRDAIRHGVSGAWRDLPESYIPQIDAILARIRADEQRRQPSQTDLGIVLDFRSPKGTG